MFTSSKLIYIVGILSLLNLVALIIIWDKANKAQIVASSAGSAMNQQQLLGTSGSSTMTTFADTPAPRPASGNLLTWVGGTESCNDTGMKSYDFVKSKNYIDKITNLIPNSIVRITFNDLSLNFKVNAEGDLYFNNEKEPLPIYALPYVDMRLELYDPYCKSGDKFLRPVAVGHGTEKLNKEAQLEFTFDLQPVVQNNFNCSSYKSEKECSNVRFAHLGEFSPCTWMSTKCVGGERGKPFFKDPPTVRRLYKIAGGSIGPS